MTPAALRRGEFLQPAEQFGPFRGKFLFGEDVFLAQIGEAFERMERADVRYRFVIDMASLSD